MRRGEARKGLSTFSCDIARSIPLRGSGEQPGDDLLTARFHALPGAVGALTSPDRGASSLRHGAPRGNQCTKEGLLPHSEPVTFGSPSQGSRG
jgi:hypothetical protein